MAVGYGGAGGPKRRRRERALDEQTNPLLKLTRKQAQNVPSGGGGGSGDTQKQDSLAGKAARDQDSRRFRLEQDTLDAGRKKKNSPQKTRRSFSTGRIKTPFAKSGNATIQR